MCAVFGEAENHGQTEGYHGKHLGVEPGQVPSNQPVNETTEEVTMAFKVWKGKKCKPWVERGGTPSSSGVQCPATCYRRVVEVPDAQKLGFYRGSLTESRFESSFLDSGE